MSHHDLVFYVQLKVKPEHVAEWKRLVTKVIENMSGEESFVACSLQQSAEDENLFTLYERWREPSVDAFMENQMGKEYRKLYEERLPVLLASPRTASVSYCLREWRKP